MNIKRTTWLALLAVGAALLSAAHAAEPPDQLNYQGVLRGTNGNPLSGDYDMIFRFEGLLGNEILVDEHVAGVAGPVSVDQGLFSVALGTGKVLDGAASLPGDPYLSLGDVFRDFTIVYLKIDLRQVGHPNYETLLPRIQLSSAPFALNAHQIGGRTADEFVDTTATAQTKSGKLILQNLNGNYGLESTGNLAGALFSDATQTGYAEVGYGNQGIRGFGNLRGGRFEDLDDGSIANVAAGKYGIEAYGSDAGGYFEDSNGSGFSQVGMGEYGIRSFGNLAGGYFDDLNGSGYAFVGHDDYGINARGDAAGGYFTDSDQSGYAYVGRGEYGIEAYGNFGGGRFEDLDDGSTAFVANSGNGIFGQGSSAGGRFSDTDDSGEAWIGFGDYGVWSRGETAGGYFEDTNGTGHSYVGRGGRGIEGFGDVAGGYFEETDAINTFAYIANGSYGIDAQGRTGGGLFRDENQAGYTLVAFGNWGIHATGDGISGAGGRFEDAGSGTWANVSRNNASTGGNGNKNFIQNHPYEPDKVVVYSSLEGDEVGTYTRGSARLVDGVAHVELGKTYALVWNPDSGLTAHVTARSAGADLYVESISTEQIVVRSQKGSDPSAAFDFTVYGLRIGFEEVPVVQPKGIDAFIPSMKANRELLADQPELRQFTAFDRFEVMHSSVSLSKAPLDLSRAQALRDAIHEFDPERDELPSIVTPGMREKRRPLSLERVESRSSDRLEASTRAKGETAPITTIAEPTRPSETIEEEAVSSTWVTLSEPVQKGALIALDPTDGGQMKLASSIADPFVIGIAASASIAQDGGHDVPLVEARYATVLVDASYGEIHAGDLLVGSATAGHAMRAPEAAGGVIVGKTIESLLAGTGTVRVLVLLR